MYHREAIIAISSCERSCKEPSPIQIVKKIYVLSWVLKKFDKRYNFEGMISPIPNISGIKSNTCICTKASFLLWTKYNDMTICTNLWRKNMLTTMNEVGHNIALNLSAETYECEVRTYIVKMTCKEQSHGSSLDR